MTVFLTGSESFIGRVLAARCRAAGMDILGIDSVPGDATSHVVDIRDPALADVLPDGATVVHLAAISRDPDCRANPKLAFDVNVNGTLNLAAAAQSRQAAQFIFASSEWVYGEVRNDAVQLEDQPIDVTRMKSAYALTKIVGEQCLKLTGSLPATTILRFGIVYGPRASNWSAVERLFSDVREQTEIRVGSAKTARRFIHVEDIVSGILGAVGRRGVEIFNLTGDAPISLGDIVEAAQQVWGREVVLIETDPDKPSIRNPDNARARRELDWRPRYDLTSGLANLKQFFETR